MNDVIECIATISSILQTYSTVTCTDGSYRYKDLLVTNALLV